MNNIYLSNYLIKLLLGYITNIRYTIKLLLALRLLLNTIIPLFVNPIVFFTIFYIINYYAPIFDFYYSPTLFHLYST